MAVDETSGQAPLGVRSAQDSGQAPLGVRSARDSGQLRARLTRMLELRAQEGGDDALLRAQVVVAFVHKDPDLVLLLSGRGEAVEVAWDTLSPAPDVLFEFSSAEVAHRFWLGELNVVRALGARTMRARGNLLKAIALLPSASSNGAAYRQAVAEEGA